MGKKIGQVFIDIGNGIETLQNAYDNGNVYGGETVEVFQYIGKGKIKSDVPSLVMSKSGKKSSE